MMELMFFWIWIGGCFAMERKKVGFIKRLFWPIHFGEMLATKVFNEDWK